MAKKMDYNEFVGKAKIKHGNDRYDYSQSVYISYTDRLNIKCNVCGNIFPQTPREHLAGCGCPTCGKEKTRNSKIGKPNMKSRKILYGVAVCDSQKVIRAYKPYSVWHGILQRCYDKNFQKKEPSYKNCSVCKEWLLFSNFERWFDENYIEGFEIDKDLLSESLNRKIYSPETCTFLPPQINIYLASILRLKSSRSLPIGVHIINKSITASVGKKYLGTFKTVEEAQCAYIKEKKTQFDVLVEKWKDKLEPRAYNALKNLDIVKFLTTNKTLIL